MTKAELEHELQSKIPEHGETLLDRTARIRHEHQEACKDMAFWIEAEIAKVADLEDAGLEALRTALEDAAIQLGILIGQRE